ncbi:MAG TPA: DUF1501 domain-containing protein [Burkholderiaceae bacterium]|nr:DUF1501 domain-containing protein [Burkholderiaceae bacterium]
MDRRNFLTASSALLSCASLPVWAAAATPRLLILVELRGGNDALNTVIPIDDGTYFDLRPRLGLKPDAVARFAGAPALHPSLAPLESMWRDGQMAILQGVGYPSPNLSHFRSIEIWDTASDSQQFLQTGWLTRTMHRQSSFAALSADGVVIGAADLGPLAGGARAVALNDPARFARQARLASADGVPARGSLAHVLRVESDIVRAGADVRSDVVFKTEFPRGVFGLAVQHAAGIAATGKVPVLRLTLPGFDTHQNQLGTHANLLRVVADSVVALRAALSEHGIWDRTLILTYSEFGRRPRENQSGGTDHGTAGTLFAFGRHVRGGMYGDAPSLRALDEGGNLRHTTDFRRVYASVLENWWRLESERVLQGRFEPLKFII